VKKSGRQNYREFQRSKVESFVDKSNKLSDELWTKTMSAFDWAPIKPSESPSRNNSLLKRN
jgi:hypothetical protein